MTAFNVGAGLLAGSGLVLLYHLYYRRQQYLLIQVLRHQRSPRSLGLTSPFFGILIHYQDSQNRLGQSLADFETLLEHLPLAYLEVDDDNQLQRWNPAAQALLKLPNVDRGRQRLLLELFRSYDLDQLIEKTRQSQTPCQREWSLNLVGTDLANPQPQPNLELRGYGIPLALGRIGVFLEDRREAVQLTQQRDRWVSDVAHELKTPLTSIRLVAETLVDRVAPPWQSWMERLLGEVVHLSHLVQDLLDLSRLERRSPMLMVASLDFVDLVNTAWDSLEPISRRRQIDLHYHGPLELFLEGDRSRLYQVVLNLLDNAIKYGPPRSVITVRLSVVPRNQVPIDRELKSQTPSNPAPSNPALSPSSNPAANTPTPSNPAASPSSNPAASNPAPSNPTPHPVAPSPQTPTDYVCLEVLDQGSGFTTEALPHVFERFYRADPARTRSPIAPIGANPEAPTPGDTLPPSPPPDRATTPPLAQMLHSGSCGLGLSIVQQIVLAHQGQVFAQNHPQGGAWLTLYLPRSFQGSSLSSAPGPGDLDRPPGSLS